MLLPVTWYPRYSTLCLYRSWFPTFQTYSGSGFGAWIFFWGMYSVGKLTKRCGRPIYLPTYLSTYLSIYLSIYHIYMVSQGTWSNGGFSISMIVYRIVSMFLPHMFGSIELGADPVWGLSHNYLLEFWRHHFSYPFDRIPFLEHMHHHFLAFRSATNTQIMGSWVAGVTKSL